MGTLRFVLGLVILLGAAACGSSSSSSPAAPSPTPTPTPSPTPPPAPGGATFTITGNGVSPRSVTIAAGSRVTFVNSDTRAHDMASDPHPDHSTCPAINDVGFLQPGQSRTTGNLNTPRSCGFHDHNQPSVAALQGTIVIQ